MASLHAAQAEMTERTPFARRLQAEWALLGQFAMLNPDRLRDLCADDCTITLRLLATPALRAGAGTPVAVHRLCIEYPRLFPAVPLELSLEVPVFHPNVHPETGFVCLWERHHPANTAEQALHRLVAMLGWMLRNTEPRHLLQPEAALPPAEAATLRERLAAPPLQGVTPPSPAAPPPGYRRRLG